MRRQLIIPFAVIALAACGSSEEGADTLDEPAVVVPAGSDESVAEPADVPADDEITVPAESAGEPPDDDTFVPGPGDAVGTLTGPDLDIAVVGSCDYDTRDLSSADIAFADVRGLDPDGVEWPVRFGLSGSESRNTQVNVNGTQVVVRWPDAGLLEQATDEGSYLLDTTIGRLLVTTADGYELNISCFER